MQDLAEIGWERRVFRDRRFSTRKLLCDKIIVRQDYCATGDELRSRFSEQEESWHHSLIPLTSGLRYGKYKMKVVLQLFNTMINNACDR